MSQGNDLVFENGDLSVGGSDEQHISHLLLSSPLDWLQHPLTGVNTVAQVNGSNTQRLKRNIIEQLKLDGYLVKRLSVDADFLIDLEVE
ncbi:hypothetical protein [uncultured Microscilla sp.]|uniref:hypothetical protein n=1 Tax=uncultured Microscilla sp. TaxID=432653 RepID=UPI0026226ACD|nr:hypothetical protein [uncultured Microscilla sp.]